MARTGPLTRNTSAVALGLAQVRIGNAAANIGSITPVLASTDSLGALGNTAFNGEVELWRLESGFPLLEDLTIPIREKAALDCAFKELSAYNVALARGIDPGATQAASVVEGVYSNTVAGTTTGDITVTQNDGPVTDTFRVFFASATTGSIYGDTTGFIMDFASLAEMEPANPASTASPANPYFNIPASFFTGTWAAGDSYVFTTKEYTTAAYGTHSGSINLGAIVAPAFIRVEAVYTYPNGTNTMTIIFPRANVSSSLNIELQTEDCAAPPIMFEAKRADSDTSGGNVVWNSMPLGRIIFA